MTRLHLTRALPVPPERVWQAFTDPAALAGWFWPAARFGTTAEVELRPGGRYRIEAPRAGMAVSGEYLKVDPPLLLVFTWQWDGEDTATEVCVTLTATTTGCTLDLVHDRFPDEARRDDNARGWSDCLDRLPAYLSAGS